MTETKRETGNKKHSLELIGRETVCINGVSEVISFDEACIVLSTVCGILSIDGASLKINSLDTDNGCVSISGTVNAMIYPEGNLRGGIFRKRQK